jgi:Cdc6-like AAA superfamily ATPase
LDHYVQQGLPQSLRNKIIDILGCLLEILACTEIAIRDGRWKKYAAVLFLGSDERVKTTFDKLTGLFESEQSLAIAIIFVTNLSMDERIGEIGNTTENLLIATRDAEVDRVRRELLRWISTVDASGQQSDNLGRRQGNTGEWFLDNPTSKQWMSGSGQTLGLFCPGAPGAGKTTMSATIIHHLSIQDHESNIAIAYLYCKYRSRNEQTLYNLLFVLFRRLVQLRNTIPSCVLDMYNNFHEKSRLTLDQCTDLITLVCKEF